MSPSEARAIRAVEVGIIATEGLWSVDGTPFTSYIEAELARHNLAQRAVAEASLLRRYIRVEPPCAWCGCAIKPNQESREIDGRLLHDTDELRCAQEFDDDLADYAAEHRATHADV
jgi:hypothetical protein